ncbi:hypothetical protein [Candidatus Frankia nodulisporulans]|uniref:hypothetical protein n=1 Tax=Candidatus Frankia nodulisporulans TaxID=2060052 RepID=UPI0013CF847B|nr:hypothetical protein [Candidatus Frankia nodulisporulans]
MTSTRCWVPEPIPVAKVSPLLLNLAPTWAAYRTLTELRLVHFLTDEGTEGIKVPTIGNRWPLDPITIREQIRRRTADLNT